MDLLLFSWFARLTENVIIPVTLPSAGRREQKRARRERGALRSAALSLTGRQLGGLKKKLLDGGESQSSQGL